MIIPWQSLSSDALNGLIEEFVSREGTEYGEEEVPLTAKVAAVIRQLEAGEVAIVFDADDGTTSVLPVKDLG